MNSPPYRPLKFDLHGFSGLDLSALAARSFLKEKNPTRLCFFPARKIPAWYVYLVGMMRCGRPYQYAISFLTFVFAYSATASSPRAITSCGTIPFDSSVYHDPE